MAPRQCRAAVLRPLFRHRAVFIRLKSGLIICDRPRLRVELDILLHIRGNVVPPGLHRDFDHVGRVSPGFVLKLS